MRLVVCIVTLAVSLTGCLGADAPSDDPSTPSGEPPSTIARSGEPTEAMLEDRSLDVHPTWYVGEWWHAEVGGATGHAFDVTIVVAGERDGRVLVGMPADAYSDVAIGTAHFPFMGDIWAANFSAYWHDGRMPMAQFPLEAGKTWEFTLRGGDSRAEVLDVDGDQATIEVTTPIDKFTLTYDARMGFVSKIEWLVNNREVAGERVGGLLAGTYQITEHGFGYEGDVIVPEDLALAMLEECLSPCSSDAPEGMPGGVVEVATGRDSMSLGLILGEFTGDRANGQYRAAATTPSGATHERTLGPIDGRPQLLDAVHVKEPDGTWQVELEAIGTGYAGIEAVAYNQVPYDVAPAGG